MMHDITMKNEIDRSAVRLPAAVAVRLSRVEVECSYRDMLALTGRHEGYASVELRDDPGAT